MVATCFYQFGQCPTGARQLLALLFHSFPIIDRLIRDEDLQSGGIVQIICMPQSLALRAASFTEEVAADSVLVSCPNMLVTDSGRKRATPARTHSCALILCGS